MNSVLLLFAVTLISFCMLQNNSCGEKTKGSNSAVPSPTATPQSTNPSDSRTQRSTSTPAPASTRQLSGTWGGNHVTLEISDQGATIEFDCANGLIREPILLNSDGGFDVPGSYVREGPGPIRQDVRRDSQARYSGIVTDETMTLAVRLEGSSEPLLNLMLTRGKQGKLRKCY